MRVGPFRSPQVQKFSQKTKEGKITVTEAVKALEYLIAWYNLAKECDMMSFDLGQLVATRQVGC